MKRRTPILFGSVLTIVATSAGYLVGYARSGSLERSQTTDSTDAAREASPPNKQVYTCSMHPQVRLDQPGNCPICEMPLIPAASASAASGETPMLQLSAHAVAMASVETVAVKRRTLSRDLRAVGRIEYNESSIATITPRVDGFAERLFVNFTGVEIRKGDHLAEVYSPELLVAQQELLIALQSDGDNSLAEVAKTRLRLLGLTDQQVADLINKKQTTDRVTLYSPISGTVIEKSLVEKASFKAGDALFRVANLDSVWIYLDIYEYDLPWVRYGQKVRITAEAIPGRTFNGVVTFVQPIVNDQSRTIRVPVYVENKDHVLKPGMFATAVIASALGSDATAAATGVEGLFTCRMHPLVLVAAPGACPNCEMELEQIPHGTTSSAPHDSHGAHEEFAIGGSGSATSSFACPMKCEGEKTYEHTGRCPICNMNLQEVPASTTIPGREEGILAVPVLAVLDSGMRQIAYVEKSPGLFEPRELTLGPRAGEYFPVLAGLAIGDRVVTRGNFLIDSQFQITGHPSLFYPGGLHASMGHQHGGTETPGGADEPTPRRDKGSSGQPASPEHKH